MIAARSVHTPFPATVSQIPFPGLKSNASSGLLTVNVSGAAAAVAANANADAATSSMRPKLLPALRTTPGKFIAPPDISAPSRTGRRAASKAASGQNHPCCRPVLKRAVPTPGTVYDRETPSHRLLRHSDPHARNRLSVQTELHAVHTFCIAILTGHGIVLTHTVNREFSRPWGGMDGSGLVRSPQGAARASC